MSNNPAELEEPKGVPFFSIKTGETHYLKLAPTISAYINSSDMGINASRDQDYGWRLGAEWVKKIRDFKRDRNQMALLTAKNQGQKPGTVQILYYIYGEELAAYYESVEEFDNPYEEEYQNSIAGRGAVQKDGKLVPAALADFLDEGDDDDDDITDLIDENIDDEEPQAPATPPAAPKAPKAPATKAKQK